MSIDLVISELLLQFFYSALYFSVVAAALKLPTL